MLPVFMKVSLFPIVVVAGRSLSEITQTPHSVWHVSLPSPQAEFRVQFGEIDTAFYRVGF